MLLWSDVVILDLPVLCIDKTNDTFMAKTVSSHLASEETPL